ncbi:MAG: hypothetical protein IKN36_06500, partial [Clostridia bacterium]|nr:hypothetical protein [Clostridia bacterium]
MAWWIYDLNTRTWDPTCHTIERFSRRCYMNVYPDGNGGFTMVTERCAPSRELGIALGCTFSTSGYLWDALYVMHVPDPNVDYAEDTTIWEPTYVAGAKNNIASASHYGTGGCTYLDTQNRLHVIYSVQYYSPSTSKTKVAGTYHAMYDLSGNELYNELIPTTLLSKNGTSTYKGPSGFAMTQGPNGLYHIFTITGSLSGTTLEIWSSSDGISFTKRVKNVALVDENGNAIAEGTKPIIANTRNGSVIDGTVALMFHHGGGSGGDPYYYFSVQLPSSHKHSFTTTVTQPTCTERGYTTKACACGAELVSNYVDALGHDYQPTVVEPTYEAGGYTLWTCSRCGDFYTTDETAPLEMTLSASLALNDCIDVRIYVNNVSPELISNGSYVEYSTDGGETFTQDSFDGHLIPETEGKYGFTVDSICANQMTKGIAFNVCDGSGEVLKSITYSVKDYCDAAIGGENADLEALCEALMAYGYYAQQRFPDTASAAIDPNEYASGIAAVAAFDEDLSAYAASASLAGAVTGASATLSLESRTVLSVYLTGVDTVDAAVTVGGEPWDNVVPEPVAGSNGSHKCRVMILGLSTLDMTKNVVLSCDGTEVSYSP